MGPRVRGDDRAPLLHAQRHEAQFAVAVGDQQQDGFLAVFLQLVDTLLDVGGIADRFLRHFDDDLAGAEVFFGGVRGAVDIRDDDTLDAVFDLVFAAQILAQGRQIEPERVRRDLARLARWELQRLGRGERAPGNVRAA